MRVCLLSLTVIEDDPRVRRQGDALAAAGHDVVALGLPGARSPAPDWPVHHVAGRRRSRTADAALAARALAGSIASPAAGRLYWSTGFARRFLGAAEAAAADVYHANDWWVLPVAQRAAQRVGGRFVYDTHEFAVEEHAGRALWRLCFPRFIHALEAGALPAAGFVTTVSDGIADRLVDRYRLPHRPTVIRNVCDAVAVEDHEPVPPYTVLYQGAFSADRGLDVLVRSVAGWRPEFQLVLRGSGPSGVLDQLRRLARPLGDRVRIDPPVPMVDMVRAAATADVGIHPIPATNRQAAYCLPNKVFEYTMAGLALCVSDLPELRRVVTRYDLGVLMDAATPEGIARAVNSFTAASLGRHRAAARRAREELNWERERTALLAAYERLARRDAGPRPRRP